MRKMFRMKYESCHGECYAHSDVMKIHNLGLDEQGAAAFLRRLLQIHGPACGNANLGFRLDVDDKLGVFVASFERFGSLDLFADSTPKGALDQLIDAALAYYQTDEYKTKLREMRAAEPCPKFRTAEDYRDHLPCARCEPHSVCRHGDDYKLVEFALAHSGLDVGAQERLRAQLLPTA